jgi:phytoene dehydrogenase-like protein
LVQYSNPDLPMAAHLNILAGCHTGRHGWPAGGSLEFARSIARRYVELGGEIHYRSPVEEILVEQDRAVGVRLDSGSEQRAGIIISNAYGPTTIFELLGSRYTSRQIRARYARPADQIEMGLHISLGVARDLSQEPHAVVRILEQPVTIAGQARDRLDLYLFGFDPSMAPPGKGVIKLELPASYAYWKALHQDRGRYREEKQRIAEMVVDMLEPRFPGLKGQVEVVDVATPVTTERYTGKGQGRTLPGLEGFYMVGQWAGSPGLPNVAGMARGLVRFICQRDGRPFVTENSRQAAPAVVPGS